MSVITIKSYKVEFILVMLFWFSLMASVSMGVDASVNEQQEKRVFLTPFELTNISEDVGKIVQSQLQGELIKNKVLLAESQEAATDILEGSLSKLGDKILIIVKAYNKHTQSYDFVENVTSYDESDLDTVAVRLARAYAQTESFADTVSVSNVIEQEEEITQLQNSLSGFLFQLGSFSPTGGDNYGAGENGIALDAGLIFETERFFYSPGIGIRRGSDESYTEVPMTLSIGKYFSNAGNSFVITGGLGISAIRETLTVRNETKGGFVPIVVEETFEEDEVGATGHIRLGYIIARERAQRLMFSLAYNVSRANPLERDLAQGLSLQIGLMTFP